LRGLFSRRRATACLASFCSTADCLITRAGRPGVLGEHCSFFDLLSRPSGLETARHGPSFLCHLVGNARSDLRPCEGATHGLMAGGGGMDSGPWGLLLAATSLQRSRAGGARLRFFAVARSTSAGTACVFPQRVWPLACVSSSPVLAFTAIHTRFFRGLRGRPEPSASPPDLPIRFFDGRHPPCFAR